MKPTQSMTSMLVERSENDGTPSTRIITDGTVMTPMDLDVSVGMCIPTETEYFTQELINCYTPCDKFKIVDVSGKTLKNGCNAYPVFISNFTFIAVTNSVEFDYKIFGEIPNKFKEYVKSTLKEEVTK